MYYCFVLLRSQCGSSCYFGSSQLTKFSQLTLSVHCVMKPRDSCVKFVNIISAENQPSVLSAASVNFIMKESDGVAKSDAMINSGIASQS